MVGRKLTRCGLGQLAPLAQVAPLRAADGPHLIYSGLVMSRAVSVTDSNDNATNLTDTLLYGCSIVAALISTPGVLLLKEFEVYERVWKFRNYL